MQSLAVTVLVMWLKLFYLLRIFFKTAFLVRMILEILYDMKWFIFVMALAVGAFAHCFFILALNKSATQLNFVNNSFFYAIIYTYQMGMGNWNVADFEQTYYPFIGYIVFVLATIVILIVLLNMLIAIMADTFTRVQESSESSMLKEIASIM